MKPHKTHDSYDRLNHEGRETPMLRHLSASCPHLALVPAHFQCVKVSARGSANLRPWIQSSFATSLDQVKITPQVFRGFSKFSQTSTPIISSRSVFLSPLFSPFCHFQALQPHKTSWGNIPAWLVWVGNYCHFSLLSPKKVFTGPVIRVHLHVGPSSTVPREASAPAANAEKNPSSLF